jgi:hypothetical protein
MLGRPRPSVVCIESAIRALMGRMMLILAKNCGSQEAFSDVRQAVLANQSCGLFPKVSSDPEPPRDDRPMRRSLPKHRTTALPTLRTGRS